MTETAEHLPLFPGVQAALEVQALPTQEEWHTLPPSQAKLKKILLEAIFGKVEASKSLYRSQLTVLVCGKSSLWFAVTMRQKKVLHMHVQSISSHAARECD